MPPNNVNPAQPVVVSPTSPAEHHSPPTSPQQHAGTSGFVKHVPAHHQVPVSVIANSSAHHSPQVFLLLQTYFSKVFERCFDNRKV